MNVSSNALRQHYYAWLASPAPYREGGGRVAGEKTVRGFRRGQAWEEEHAGAWKAIQEAVGQQGRSGADHKVWVWSDLHLFHANIIRYSKRPFYSAEQMNADLLAAAQAVVGPQDWLLFLGDLSLGPMEEVAQWMEQVPGRKACILGNHDVDRQEKWQAWQTLGFEAVADVQALELPEPWEMADGTRLQALWLTHYPLPTERIPPGVLNVHGHTHDVNLGGRRLNVSVEQVGYRPQELRPWVESQRLSMVATTHTHRT